MLAYIFNADVYHGACVVEELIGAGELSPAARDMDVEEVLWQGASANAIDYDDESSYDSNDWPKSVLMGSGGDEHMSENHCGRCLTSMEEEPPCDADDPHKRKGYACVYRLHHDTDKFAHRFERTDDDN